MGGGHAVSGRGRTALVLLLATSLTLAFSHQGGRPPRIVYMYAPLSSTDTFLVGEDGVPLHTWSSRFKPGQSAFLQRDGSLIRAGAINALAPDNRFVQAWENSGAKVGFNVGGIVERIGTAGQLLWSIAYFSDHFAPHHDAIALPSGNLLMPVWRYNTEEEAIAKGRNPSLVGAGGLWLDSLVELRVRGPHDYEVVWEWRTSDHLVQDRDPTKANFGSVADNPQLIDINHVGSTIVMPAEDLMHTNSVIYIEELDQIVLTVFNYSELWVIDHSTTTEEAASHRGGRYGRGGDLLYRWGNPSAYGRGTVPAFNLSGVHDANWTPDRRWFAMLDNNNPDPTRNLAGGNSRVVVIRPPMRRNGAYTIGADGVFGPVAPRLAADLGFEEMALGTAIRLPDGTYSSCDCLSGQALRLGARGRVVDAINLWPGTVGQPVPSFRITPYSSHFPGVRALLRPARGT